MNPLFNQLGNALPQNMQAMLNAFATFKSSFSGDPRQQVQNLLNSGQMSQSQFNQLSKMADEFQKMIR